MRPQGSPWTAARGMVFKRDGTWYATVTNWYGLVVWGDNTGEGGQQVMMESAHRMTYVIRQIDGIGQGKRLRRWSEVS